MDGWEEEHNKKVQKQEDADYHDISDLSLGIDAPITRIKLSNGYKGRILIYLSDNKQLRMDGSPAYNYEYKPSSLHDFLQEGHAIYKKKGDDTLRIKTAAGRNYYFVFGRNLNKNKR